MDALQTHATHPPSVTDALGFTPLARMVTSDNIISTLSRQSKDSVVSVPAFIWYPHYLNVFYKICYVYCNDGNVFQSTWTTLKTLEEDSAVSGEENDSFKRRFQNSNFKCEQNSTRLLSTVTSHFTSYNFTITSRSRPLHVPRHVYFHLF